MRVIGLILLIYFILVEFSLFADPSNPQATRGNITVLSSEFGEGEIAKKYPVSSAIDGNPQTAWVFEKNASSFKEIVGLLFDFKSVVEIDGISLINGYAKNDSLYKFNNSINTFKIILPNHQVYNYSCTESTKFQDFKFPRQKVKWMIIIVTDQRKGRRYNDLCISEISPTFKNDKLIYKQGNFIISNNGAEYESDLLINLQNQKQFNTDKFDFGCGAQGSININDSTMIYSDECDDNSHIEIFYLNQMNYKTIKNKQLNNFTLIDAISVTKFIVMDKKSENLLCFNSTSNKFTPTDYVIKKYFSYWRWSERLDKDLSEKYKKIE